MRSVPYDMARLRKIAALVRGQTVLDIGYAQVPNPYLRDCHRVGFDLNRPTNTLVRYDEEICGDANSIAETLHGRQFDTIICGELIEHLENPYAFLRDLRQLLTQNGRLIVTTPNPLGWPVVICEILRLRRFFYTTEHLYYLLPRWVVRLLEHSGYSVAAIRAVGWWLPFGVLGLCPASLSYQVIYVAHNRPMTVSS